MSDLAEKTFLNAFIFEEEVKTEGEKNTFKSSSIIGEGKQYESWVSLEIEKQMKQKKFKIPIRTNIKYTEKDEKELLEKMKSGIKKFAVFWKRFYVKLGKMTEKTDENAFFLKFKEFETDLLIVLEEGEELSSADFLSIEDSFDKQQKFLLKGPCKIIIEITQNSEITFEKFLQLEKDILYLKHKYYDPGVVYAIIITNQKYIEGLKHFDLAVHGLLETIEADTPEIKNLINNYHLFYLYKKYVNLVEKIADQEEKIANLKVDYDEKINNLKLEIYKLKKNQFPPVVLYNFELFKI